MLLANISILSNAAILTPPLNGIKKPLLGYRKESQANNFSLDLINLVSFFWMMIALL